MALPKYAEPAVHNETQGEATGHIDSRTEPPTTGKNKTVEKEKTENPNNDSYVIMRHPQGAKDDTISNESDELIEEETDYGFDEDDDELDDAKFYGKEL